MKITFDDDTQAQDFYVAIIDEIADNEKTAKSLFGKPEYKKDIKALDDDTKILKRVQAKYEKRDLDFSISEMELITITIDDQIEHKQAQYEDFSRLKMETSAENARKDVESLKRIRAKL